MSDSKTNVDDFVGELNAGMFKEKLGLLLSQAALGTIINGTGNKKGKVTVEFSFIQIGENEQVVVSTKLSHSTPTKRGKKTEEDCTDTPMFVGKGGVLTIDQPKESYSGQFGLDAQQDGIRRVK